MNFRVGQKVVCVDTNLPCYGQPFIDADGRTKISNGDIGNLVSGAIYTIQAIIPNTAYACLVLAEINRGRKEPGYRATRFRSLIEKTTETGMAILREILDRETVSDKPGVPAKQL